jgi:hypothetical protein
MSLIVLKDHYIISMGQSNNYLSKVYILLNKSEEGVGTFACPLQISRRHAIKTISIRQAVSMFSKVSGPPETNNPYAYV